MIINSSEDKALIHFYLHLRASERSRVLKAETGLPDLALDQ